MIYQAEEKDDLSELHDQLSDVNESGTDVSSEYSGFESVNDDILGEEQAERERELKAQR